MKLNVIIHCHGNEPNQGYGKVMAHMYTSCRQSFIAVTSLLLKLQLILVWQLNVDVYEFRQYHCCRCLNSLLLFKNPVSV